MGASKRAKTVKKHIGCYPLQCAQDDLSRSRCMGMITFYSWLLTSSVQNFL